MTEALKPCPFCGSPAELKHDSGTVVYGQTWWVSCTSCWANGLNLSSGTVGTDEKRDAEAKAGAVAAWNRRCYE